MTEQRSVIFILDGAANGGPCGVTKPTKCLETATGTYEVADAETCAFIVAVQLCSKHGAQLATGAS